MIPRPVQPRSPLPAPAPRRAFSLIELLVVLAILAIIATVALPATRALAKSNSRAQAANQVRAYLNQARAIAIAQHRQAGVVFFEETLLHGPPVHANQTAMQLFVEDYDQSAAKYPTRDPKNTIFLAYSAARDYLPLAVHLATLNDQPRGEMTGDETTGGKTRAVLFDPNGNLITRHGLARPPIPVGSADAKTYGDWNFASQGSDPSLGIAAPGIFLYDHNEFLAQHIPTDATGNAQRDAWIKQNADAVIINSNTGGLLQ